MYVEYEYYKSLYGDKALGETEFNRLVWEAEREINKATSGVDGVQKLKIAFPVNDEDAEVVKRCVCALVEFLSKLEVAESGASFVRSSNGTVHGGIVSSVSAGNESISYSTNETSISNAIKSESDRSKTIYAFIASRLYGVSDANGINLLYVGRYPYEVKY